MIRIATPLNLGILAAMVAVIAAGFVLVPPGTDLPVHWNLAGEADLVLPRETALLMPLAITGLAWVIFAVIDRKARPDDRRAGAHVTSVVVTALTALFLAIAGATVAIGMGMALSMVHVVAAGVGVLLVVLGNALPKSQPNSFAGLRIPSTLSDPANWQATHRLTGLLCIVGGLVLLAATLLVSPAQMVFWIVACVLGPMLVGTVYSLMRRRRA